MSEYTARMSPVLVSDFDGTMTRYDFYRIALAQLVPPETPDFWEDYLVGKKTHFEALAAIFTYIKGDAAAVMAAAHAMDIDPHLGEAIHRLQTAGWEVVVASAGCRWYIDRLLAEQGVQITVHTNPGTLQEGKGLMLELPKDSPYFSSTTGIDKEAVVRAMVEMHDCVAFAGDGRPDLPAALLVPPRCRFARGWLAEYLTAEGMAFRPFDRWSEIAALLLEEHPC